EFPSREPPQRFRTWKPFPAPRRRASRPTRSPHAVDSDRSCAITVHGSSRAAWIEVGIGKRTSRRPYCRFCTEADVELKAAILLFGFPVDGVWWACRIWPALWGAVFGAPFRASLP